MPKPLFRIKIDGHTPETVVSPETVSAGDLAKVLEKVEKAILDTARAQGAVLPDEPALSLVGIESGSDVLVWGIDPAAREAATTVTSAIQSGNYADLTGTAHQALHELWGLCKRLGWAMKFAASQAAGIVDAVINPDEEISALSEVTGATTIYGQCIRVGGEENATAKIRLLNGHVITASMTPSLAKRLAEMLYEEVALEGEATWAADTFEVVKFKTENLVAYKSGGLMESFERLHQAGGSLWDSMNVEQYLEDLRAD